MNAHRYLLELRRGFRRDIIRTAITVPLVLLLLTGLAYALSPKIAEREIGEGQESGFTYYVTKIDGCEYVVTKAFHSEFAIAMVHKGDCSNPAHQLHAAEVK